MKSKRVEEAELMQKLGIDSSSKRRRKWKWIIIIIILLAILAAGTTAYRNKKEQVGAAKFRTKPVETGQLSITVTATGTLKPTNQVEVGSELSGNVKTVEVQYNDHVKEGQVLATLDASRYEAQVMQSKASLESAQADILNAEATEKEARDKLDRLKQVWELSGNKVPSQTELEAAEAALQRAQASLATAKARVSQAQATLEENQTNISKLVIRSPINGIVLNRKIEPGQTVAGSSFQISAIFTLAEDLSKMELHVDVDEADVGQVREGQEATFTVDAYPDRSFDARIRQVRYEAKTTSGVVTYETVLDVDNPELLLRPGMTATALIVVDKLEDVMLIDNAALRFMPSEEELALYSGPKEEEEASETIVPDINNTKTVWTLRDNVLIPIKITTGLTNWRMTQVTGGDLEPGTALITGTESELK